MTSATDATPERWRIELFGGLRASRGERVLTHFETRKVSALLACLALHPRGCTREILAEQLWPEEDGAATRSRLRHALSCLRRELEPPGTPEGGVLVANRAEICLNAAAVSTDVAEFDAALARAARSEDPSERVAWLRCAVELYTGDLFPACYEEWVIGERERFARARESALVDLGKSLALLGDLSGALQAARQAVGANPLREDARCDLMRYLAAAGRGSEALQEYRELERVLREELGSAPSSASRSTFEELRRGTTVSAPPGAAPPAGSGPDLEAEGGAVPLGSRFYVTRPIDTAFQRALARADSIVLVKGPRQSGKTSLLARGLESARGSGARVVLLDLQKLGREHLDSAATLFRAFGEMIADELDLNLSLDEVWNPERGWNVNFERFLRREVLSVTEAPLVWGLDEVDLLFGYPFSSVVFGLFRSWHNQRSLNPSGPWSRLTLAISYATEAHLFITDLNQSPFNVGTRLTLDDFTRGEVDDVNRRYGSPLRGEEEIDRYYRLVGGHPYLVRRGLHALADGEVDLNALEAGADRIFSDHLGRMLAALTQDAELCNAVRAVVAGKPCPTAAAFYRLRSAGVLAGDTPPEARPRCRLYALTLEAHLR